MKFSYKFSQLMGTVYRKGNVTFTSNGDCVIAPVGNKISCYDLKSNKSETLPIESRFNYTSIDLSPNGCILIAINEDGEAHLISLISKTILHRFRFNRPIRCVKFSPDGKHFALTKENAAFVYRAPGPFSREYNPFVMERVFHAAFDETTCIDWSSDSKVLLVGAKDMSARLYPIKKTDTFRTYALGGHTDILVGCFFERDSLDAYTVARNGHVSVWESSLDLTDICYREDEPKERDTDAEDLEKNDAEESTQVDDAEKEEEKADKKFFYKRLARHYFFDVFKGEKGLMMNSVSLTSVAYHQSTKLLITGFSHGAFLLHEMPEANLIHSLKISDQEISSIAVNLSGDWIALGCSGLGQLLVWEWQSETYVMKQQGHFNAMTTVAYSPDGSYLATGGEDAKVKVWDNSSGFCFVTFTEHTAAITGIVFTQSGKALLSASLDGTVRAFDLTRYRNFRTLTSPKPAQFSCITVDASGELVAAGGQDVFDIFLWSLQTGKLLEIVSGHEGPISSLSFSPNPASSMLASVSWDKTLRIWDAVDTSLTKETLTLTADGLAVAFRPDGLEVAVTTLDGHISIFDPHRAVQLSTIEGRNDLGSGRSDTDLITAKKNLQGKAFTTVCYSADGTCVLAGGQSKNICIYQVKEKMLVKRFEITQNRSLDAMDDFINRRKMTEFGNISLVEDRDIGESTALRLPGVRRGDKAARSFKPEVRVTQVQFSPTGRSFAATTTEGLLIYSLDANLIFEPNDLTEEITPKNIRAALARKDFSRALVMALRLNEQKLISQVYEHIPVDSIRLVVQTVSSSHVERLLRFVAGQLEASPHLDFNLQWTDALLYEHGTLLQRRSPATVAILRDLQRHLTRKHEDLRKICDFNKFTLQYILSAAGVYRKRAAEENVEEENLNGLSDAEMSE